MALMPWDYGTEFGPYRSVMRGYGLAIPLIEMLVVVAYLQTGGSLFALIGRIPRLTVILFVLLALWAVFSASVIAVFKLRALLSLPVFLLHTLFALVIVDLGRSVTTSQRRTFCLLVAFGVVVYCALWAISLLWFLPKGDQWITHVPGVSNVRGLGFFSTVGFYSATALLLIEQHDKRYLRLSAYFCATVALGLGFWTGSRGAVVANLAGALLVTILAGKWRSQFAVFFIATFLMALLLSIVLPSPNPFYGVVRFGNSIIGADQDVSSGRLLLWQLTIPQILDSPIVGWGLDQFKGLGPRPFRGYNQPHNILLQIWFSVGMVGFVLIAGIATDLLRRASFIFDSPDAVVALGAAAALLVYAQYDAALYYNYSIMMFAVAIAGAFAKPQLQPASDKSG